MKMSKSCLSSSFHENIGIISIQFVTGLALVRMQGRPEPGQKIKLQVLKSEKSSPRTIQAVMGIQKTMKITMGVRMITKDEDYHDEG